MTDFAIRNLSVLSYAQGFTCWHYRRRGPLAETLEPGFFNPASDMMEQGDMIMISAADGGAHAFVSSVDKEAGPVVVAVMGRTP